MYNKFFVEIKSSKKTGKLFPCLTVDTGSRKIMLSFDRAVIAEILDVSPRHLSELAEGTVIEI